MNAIDIYVCMYVHTKANKDAYINTIAKHSFHHYSIAVYACTGTFKTHNSETRGQKEAGRMQRMSVIFTRRTTVKYVNTLYVYAPLKLSLSYQGLSTF